MTVVIKKLNVNKNERKTFLKLKDILGEYNVYVCPKIRVADVFQIEKSGITNEQYSYALKAHFDYVAVDEEDNFLFAVEFDGGAHADPTQQKRDKIKNELCEKFNFPILRIDSYYFNKKLRNMDILTWCIEVWFAQKWFIEAQENGEFSYDEPFMPMSIINVPHRKEKFPYYLSIDIRQKIREMSELGECKDLIPTTKIYTDDEGNYHAIAFIRIDEKKGVFAKSFLKNNQFPIDCIELVENLVLFPMYDKLVNAINRPNLAMGIKEIEKKVNFFDSKYYFRAGGGQFII